jgi:hypothetical protein
MNGALDQSSVIDTGYIQDIQEVTVQLIVYHIIQYIQIAWSVCHYK